MIWNSSLAPFVLRLQSKPIRKAPTGIGPSLLASVIYPPSQDSRPSTGDSVPRALAGWPLVFLLAPWHDASRVLITFGRAGEA
jgi:hypothetical protein